MKFRLLSTTLIIFACTNTAAAEPSDYPGISLEELTATRQADSRAPGVPLVSFERGIWAVGDYVTDNVWYGRWEDRPGAVSAPLGILAYQPFDGGHPLYQCTMKYRRMNKNKVDYFTSRDANCEGQTKPKSRQIIGYVATTQWAGTRPLYRCYMTAEARLDHFDSLDWGCEGHDSTVNEGVIGYVWL